MEGVAADQIKRACQNYWGDPGVPGPSPCYGTEKSVRNSIIYYSIQPGANEFSNQSITLNVQEMRYRRRPGNSGKYQKSSPRAPVPFFRFGGRLRTQPTAITFRKL